MQGYHLLLVLAVGFSLPFIVIGLSNLLVKFNK